MLGGRLSANHLVEYLIACFFRQFALVEDGVLGDLLVNAAFQKMPVDIEAGIDWGMGIPCFQNAKRFIVENALHYVEGCRERFLRYSDRWCPERSSPLHEDSLPSN